MGGLRAAIGASVAVVTLVGCGGDDGSAPAPKREPQASAVRPAEDGYTAAARLKHALASRDCSHRGQWMHPLYRFDRKSCRMLVGLHPEVGEGSTIDAKQYGTGLIVLINYRFKAALALDRTRRFKLFTMYESRGGPIHPDRSTDAVANTAIAAIATGDCHRLYRVSAIPDPKGMTAREFCARPTLRPVRAALKQDAGARPERLGGDGAFAFYSLQAANRYFTVVLVGGRRYGFVDAFPAQ